MRKKTAVQGELQSVAMIVHELRTPLQGIIGMADMAAESTDPVRRGKYLGLLKESAGSLLAIVNDILDYSSMNGRKLPLETRPFDLRGFLEDVVQLLIPQARAKGLEMRVEFDRRLPDTVMGDAGRLRQILLNLAGNAVKFTDHGQVVIEANLQESKRAALVVHFAVSDTGMGIPKREQARIFNAFVRMDDPSVRTIQGAGLGLAVTAELVRRMRGRIWVESKLGAGSTFHFTLSFPAGSNATGRLPTDSKVDAFRRSRTGASVPAHLSILLAEDNRTSQLIFEHQLRSEGHTVTVVKNGRQAIKQWEQGDFDLILMDVSMPILDGHKATAMIRQREKGSVARRKNPITIIGLTAMNLKGDEDRCLQSGMNGYLSKPVTREKLLEVIGKIVRSVGRRRESK